MSAKAACCFVENGNPCDCGGVYQVTLHQLERTVAAKRAKNQPELLYDYFVRRTAWPSACGTRSRTAR